MKCPACDFELSKKNIEGIELDVCEGGCGGIWFDNLELQKFDEAHECAGGDFLNIRTGKSKERPGPPKPRKCPKCPAVVMTRHYFDTLKKVIIDECSVCGGIWLDAGELAVVRGSFKTEAERKETAGKYFSNLFDKELAKMRAQSRTQAEKARKFARALHFICPSYWIPGRQKGGAF